MRLVFSLSLILAFAACDTAPLTGGDTPFVYATKGTDMALDLVQAPSGDLIVVGSTEGKPRPADGTLALPSVLRFGLDGELISAEVYRDVGYGDVTAAVLSRNGLALAVSAGPDGPGDRTVGVFRADESGRREATLLGLDQGSTPRRALVPTSAGGVITAVYAPTASAPQVYRLNASGGREWGARLEGAREVFGLASAPGGDIYAYGAGPEGYIVARLSGSDGSERWRRILDAGWEMVAFAQTRDGLVLLDRQYAEGSVVRAVWLGDDGQERRTQVIAQEPPGRDKTSTSNAVSTSTIASLPGGRVAIALHENSQRPSDEGAVTSSSSSVVILDEDGTERARESFGIDGRYCLVSAIVPLADGRIAVAGSVGPEEFGGYGGDDFDIWVTLYDLD